MVWSGDAFADRQERGELIPRPGGIVGVADVVGEIVAAGQGVGVLRSQDPFAHGHQPGELIPRGRRITGPPGPVGTLAPGGQRVGVLGPQDPLAHRHQPGELIPRGRRIARLPHPHGQAYLASEVAVRRPLLRLEVHVAGTRKYHGVVWFDALAPRDSLGSIFPVVRSYVHISLGGYRAIERRHHPGGQCRVDLFDQSAKVSLGEFMLLNQVRQAPCPALGQRGTHFLPLRPSRPGNLFPGFIETPLGHLGLFRIPLAQQIAESAPGRIPRITVGGSHHCPSSLRRQRE
jgi:hypothetical protein